ncbi:MAG: DnaJ domain-containing protein [Clostridiales bacterium]|jgi:hypothetical protein|nr:DnaJ domain-containing protein [Clostridiales bacterium]
MTYSEQIQNALNTLGLEPTATEAQVKVAYKTLSKKYHPDLAANKNDAKEQERLNNLQAQLNYARDILQEYFDLQKDKEQVSEKEQAKAITLMYNAIFKQELDKTKSFICKTEDSIKHMLVNFGAQAFNNAKPLFNDAEKLVAEQKEILNKYSTLASPIFVSMQTKNIQQLEEYISFFDYFSYTASETLPKALNLFNDAAKIPPETEPTIQVVLDAFKNELEALKNSVKSNGPASIKDKNVGRFLDDYYSFLKCLGALRLPKEIVSNVNDNFDKYTYDFIRLINLINEKLPLNKSFNNNTKVESFNDAIDYLLQNIDAHLKDSLLKNDYVNPQLSEQYYRVKFFKILNSIAEQHPKGSDILYRADNAFTELQDEVSHFFKFAKANKQYYFLKDYNLETPKNSFELLSSIGNYTEDLVKQYTTSIFSKQNNDTPSALDDPFKFSESINKFIADFELQANKRISEYVNVGARLYFIALNFPSLAFIKNNFSGFLLENDFKDKCYTYADKLYENIATLSSHLIRYAWENTNASGNPITPKYLREFIDTVSNFTKTVEDWEIANVYSKNFSHEGYFSRIRKILKTAEEMEKMMKLPHHNDVCKQIYKDAFYSIEDWFLIKTVTANIDKSYQKLLIKAMFDSDKTLTENDEHFLEFSKEYLSNADKDFIHRDFQVHYKSATHIQETLDSLKNSGLDINNSKEIQKFVANRFNKNIFERPQDIIKLTSSTYGDDAAKKIALMLLEPSLEYNIKNDDDYFHPPFIEIIWTNAIPSEELSPIINKYKDKIATRFIEQINKFTGLNIQPTPPPPAPTQTLSR